MQAKNMREVVERLRADSSEVLLELAELEYAMSEVSRQHQELVGAARQARENVETLIQAGRLEAEVAFTFAHADRVLQKAEQVEACVREIERGIQAWGIGAGAPQEG